MSSRGGLPPSLWPSLKQIEKYLEAPVNEAFEWYKLLQVQNINTLAQAAGQPATEWLEIGIPLRVLVELRALHRLFMAEVKVEQERNMSKLKSASLRRRTLQSSKENYQSFEDLSSFIKTTNQPPETNEKEKKKKGVGRSSRPRNPVQSLPRNTKLVLSDVPKEGNGIEGRINIVGRVDHPQLLLNQSFRGHPAIQSRLPISMSVTLNDCPVALEIHNCAQSFALDCSAIILVFARNDIRSFAKVIDKYFQTAACDNLSNMPILLVGVIAEVAGRSCYASKADALEGLTQIQGLRYIEVTSSKSAREVFVEAARMVLRRQDQEATKPEIIQKISKSMEKKSGELTLKKKNLTILPNHFLPLALTLRKLRLDGNRFTHFPSEVLLCEELRELGLNNNQITEIPTDISRLFHLTRLEMEHNLLDSLPIRSIQELIELTDLKMTGNPLSNVPAEVMKGKNLKLELLQAYKDESSAVIYTPPAISLSSAATPFKVFDVDLHELMVNEYNLFPDNPLPRIVRYCINFTLTHGVLLEGVFRVGGQATQMLELRDEIDALPKIEFGKALNPHNVTGIFKQWLRSLPEPPLLFDSLERIIKLGDLEVSDQIASFKEIIKEMPVENYHLLRQVLRLMYIVGQNKEVNRMDYANVAKVIGPNLARPQNADANPMESLSKINLINDIFTVISHHYPEAFEGDGVDLFEVDYLQDCPTSAVFYRKLSGHNKSIMATHLSSDSKYIWTGDSKGTFRIWNTQTTELVRSFDGSACINCMARVGNKMWLGTSEGIQIRNESTGDLIWEILDSPCYRCAVVDNEIWIGDQVGDVHIYNTENFDKTSLEAGVPVMTLIQVGQKVWGACADRLIRMWNVETRVCEGQLTTVGARLNSFSLIEGNVWGCFDNSSIMIWNPETCELMASLDKHHNAKVFGATQVGNAVWTYAWDGQIHLFDAKTFEYYENLPSYHADAIGDVVSIVDEQHNCHRVFTSSWDKTVTVWLAKTPVLPVDKNEEES